MANEFEVSEPQEQQYTQWHNPTSSVVKADLYVETTKHRPTGRVRYTWQPGEVKPVPSELNDGLRRDDGSGHAPQLRKVTEEEAAEMKESARRAARDAQKEADRAARDAEKAAAAAAKTQAQDQAKNQGQAQGAQGSGQK